MSRNIKFSFGEFYHIYNRGTEKRQVFLNNKDRDRFVALLYLCNWKGHFKFRDFMKANPADFFDEIDKDDSPLVSIGAYCLMPNHFHLLLKEVVDGGVSRFMHKLATAYTMYFNMRNKRNGVLFQGRFKAEHLDSDTYLKYIFSYIHLNPIKLIDKNWKEEGIKDFEKAKKYLDSYEYSSYADYMDVTRPATKLLSKSDFPDYFASLAEFEASIDDWLSYREKYTG